MSKFVKIMLSSLLIWILVLVLLRQYLALKNGVMFEPLSFETFLNYFKSYNGLYFTNKFISEFGDLIQQFSNIASTYSNIVDQVFNAVKTGFQLIINFLNLVVSFVYVVFYTVVYLFNLIPYILGFEWSNFILT